MMQTIVPGVRKIYAGSNAYYLDQYGILIDTGVESNRKELLSMINPSAVKTILLTHMHYDHIGNVECFLNADIYASKEEIDCLTEKPLATVLDSSRARVIEGLMGRIKAVPSFPMLRVISCPGHTKGSIALFMDKEGILFSGDTLFSDGIGRTDLPTSLPEKMEGTLKKLRQLKYRILCPGHG